MGSRILCDRCVCPSPSSSYLTFFTSCTLLLSFQTSSFLFSLPWTLSPLYLLRQLNSGAKTLRHWKNLWGPFTETGQYGLTVFFFLISPSVVFCPPLLCSHPPFSFLSPLQQPLIIGPDIIEIPLWWTGPLLHARYFVGNFKTYLTGCSHVALLSNVQWQVSVAGIWPVVSREERSKEKVAGFQNCCRQTNFNAPK